MDIQMPGIDGLETTRRIRASDTPSRVIPIIALTALGAESIRARCDEAGVTAIATKPINAERLGHMLHTWIAQGGLPHPAAPKDDDAFADRDNAQWLGHIQRDWIASGEKLSPEDEAAALADVDEDEDAIEVSDVFLECLVADVGLARARILVQSFGQDAMARSRQLRELLPAWEVGTIIQICNSLEGVATTFGAVTLCECLLSLADAARRDAREEAGWMMERLDIILVPTLSILMARLAGIERQPPGRNPKAA
jgi:CheY-like chemotaxis protein